MSSRIWRYLLSHHPFEALMRSDHPQSVIGLFSISGQIALNWLSDCAQSVIRLPLIGDQIALNRWSDRAQSVIRLPSDLPQSKSWSSVYTISHSSCMSVIYQQHKDEDGFVYMAYSGENSMGWLTCTIVTNSFVTLHENTNTDITIVLPCSLVFSLVQKLHVCTCTYIHFYLTPCPSCSLVCTSNSLYFVVYIVRTAVHVLECNWFEDYPLSHTGALSSKQYRINVLLYMHPVKPL